MSYTETSVIKYWVWKRDGDLKVALFSTFKGFLPEIRLSESEVTISGNGFQILDIFSSFQLTQAEKF